MIKLIEIVKSLDRYELREVFVNPQHVISLREDNMMKRNLQEGRLPQDMDSRQTFTRLTLDKGTVGVELVVVGTPQTVESKLNNDRRILNG